MDTVQSDEEDYSVMGSDIEDDLTWIDWFCNVKGNEFYIEVDEDYIRDDFNLTGLNTVVKHFDRALDIILDDVEEDDDDDDDEINGPGEADSTMVAAQTLYGLIHARFILTNRGLAGMLEKYNSFTFGTCPNLYCHNQPVAPIGFSDRLNYSTTSVFCPRCNEAYEPESSRLGSIDGAFFGTTFAHIFFLQYEQLIPTQPVPYYVPRIYGFNVWRGLKDNLRNECATSIKQLTILDKNHQRSEMTTNKTRTDTTQREDVAMRGFFIK